MIPTQAGTAAELLTACRLEASGSVAWGRRPGTTHPGVYVVTMPSPLANAPVDLDALSEWIARRPQLSWSRDPDPNDRRWWPTPPGPKLGHYGLLTGNSELEPPEDYRWCSPRFSKRQ